MGRKLIDQLFVVFMSCGLEMKALLFRWSYKSPMPQLLYVTNDCLTEVRLLDLEETTLTLSLAYIRIRFLHQYIKLDHLYQNDHDILIKETQTLEGQNFQLRLLLQ